MKSNQHPEDLRCVSLEFSSEEAGRGLRRADEGEKKEKEEEGGGHWAAPTSR